MGRAGAKADRERDALRLEIVYCHDRDEATIKVTITDESAVSLSRATSALTSDDQVHGSAGCPQRGSQRICAS